MKNCVFLFLLGITLSGWSQTTETPFVKLVNPTREKNVVTATRQFIVGSTCKTCELSVNDVPVKVYNSGGFAHEITVEKTDTVFTLKATSSSKKTISKSIEYSYAKPKREEAVTIFDIASIQTFPEGDLVLLPGDKIQIKAKAFPGALMKAGEKIVLHEMPADYNNGLKGIYQGEYTVQETDSLSSSHFVLSLIDKDGKTISKKTKHHFSVMSNFASDIAITKGRLAYLEYGLGEDRLGGAKIGYLDSLVQLKIIGKVGSDYKVQLAKNRVAYIPDEHVTLMPKGSFTPASLTGAWSVYGDQKYDYVSLSLSNKLPYQSMQEMNPSRIIVDVFGATNNSNWITQLQTAKEVDHVDYEQIADDIFRLKIKLKHQQHWGHQIYYRGNTLVIKIKQQPKQLQLSNLIIAVDAGHGGSNTGATGPTGSLEKVLTLEVSLKLQALLLKAGAKVTMTRNTEKLVDNKERILFYRDSTPDLLVSIHLNSAADPIRAGGTSTHYRYIGYKSLNDYVNKRMQELGLRQYGVIGSFNFMLNSPTEYPNVLVETLFLSNPAEEALMLDPQFQQQMAEKILQGIQDFLVSVEKNAD